MRPAHPSDSRTILHHMVEAVSATPVQETPFPHFTVTDFFPADVFAQMLSSLPEPDLYEPFGYDGARGVDMGQSRSRFRFENDSLDRLSTPQRELWYNIRAAFADVQLKEVVYDKLASGLCRRFGCDRGEVLALPGFPLPELFRETTGYRIKPHPDTRAKVVTMQVSLASDESQADLGTEFYRPSLRPQALLREPRGFSVVRKMPFLPNSAYAFVVLNTVRMRSWHGRSTLPTSAGVRNSLLNFWYEVPDRGNRDLLAMSSSRVRS